MKHEEKKYSCAEDICADILQNNRRKSASKLSRILSQKALLEGFILIVSMILLATIHLESTKEVFNISFAGVILQMLNLAHTIYCAEDSAWVRIVKRFKENCTVVFSVR